MAAMNAFYAQPRAGGVKRPNAVRRRVEPTGNGSVYK